MNLGQGPAPPPADVPMDLKVLAGFFFATVWGLGLGFGVGGLGSP